MTIRSLCDNPGRSPGVAVEAEPSLLLRALFGLIIGVTG